MYMRNIGDSSPKIPDVRDNNTSKNTGARRRLLVYDVPALIIVSTSYIL